MTLTLPDLPAPLAFGTVVGTFISVLADSSDSGNSPDATYLSGTVSITPTVRTFRITGDTPRTVVTQVINAQVVNGQLLGPDGVTPLRIMASESPNISPARVQYTAKFALKGVAAQPDSVTFDVPANGTIDLSTVIPMPPAAPIVTVVSEESRIAAEAARDAAIAAAAEASNGPLTPLGTDGPTFSPGNNYWLDMNGRGIYSLASPIAPDHVATKGYVDGSFGFSNMPAVADLDTAPDGWGVAIMETPGNPTGDTVLVLTTTQRVSHWGGQYRFQLLTTENTKQSWVRREFEGEWSGWSQKTEIPADVVRFNAEGWIDVKGKGVGGLGLPISPEDATSKAYVDAHPLTPLADTPWFDPSGWLDMRGHGLYNLPEPSQPGHVTSKAYVDSRIVALTQAEYDALAAPDPSVLYLIAG